MSLKTIILVASIGAVCSLSNATPLSGQGTWETTLSARDLDGDATNGSEAFYDSTLNITWLKQVVNSLTWFQAVNLASQSHFGLSGWRLPRHVDTGLAGCDYAYIGTDCGYNVDVATGEIAHLFRITLGNLDYYNTAGGVQPNYGWRNTGEFALSGTTGTWEIFHNAWYGQSYPGRDTDAWSFGGSIGTYVNGKARSRSFINTFVVRDGDVLVTVPEPKTFVLLLAGLAAVVLATSRISLEGLKSA